MTPRYLYVPLLPLPNVVLFPNTLLPLHIFEPRYRNLVEAALSLDRLMGVALLKPGWEETYYDCPPVYRTLGMGKIIEHEKLANGNYNIWLSGVQRVHVIHEVQERPFRVAKVQILNDRHHPSQAQALVVARRQVADMARRLAAARPDMREQLSKGMDEHVYPGAMADSLASVVCADVYDKQCILSETDLTRRLRLIGVQVLARLREAIAQGPMVQGPMAQGPGAKDPSTKGPAAQGPSAKGPLAKGPVSGAMPQESAPPDSRVRPGAEA